MRQEEEKRHVLEAVDVDERLEALDNSIAGRDTIRYEETLPGLPNIDGDTDMLKAIRCQLATIDTPVVHREGVDETQTKGSAIPYADLEYMRPDDLLNIYLRSEEHTSELQSR